MTNKGRRVNAVDEFEQFLRERVNRESQFPFVRIDDMPQVDEGYDGKEIEVTVGRTLEVRLKENPTAGFRWNLTSQGEPQCKLLNDSFEAPSATQGQGGIHSWKFRAEENGEGQIKLAYARTWQQDAKPAQTFTLKVRVTEK